MTVVDVGLQRQIHGDDVAILHESAESVAGNLLLDEHYLQEARQSGRRVLRFWQGSAPTVVLGHSERPEVVVHQQSCDAYGIPVVKRLTGGGTVLQSHGVVNYALTTPDTGRLDFARVFGWGTTLVIRILQQFGVEAHACGISDVAVGDRKISGNAQARRRGALLLHGSILLHMDYALVEAVLRHPPREPAYRAGRSHRDFMITLRELGVPCTAMEVVQAGVATAQTFVAAV